VTAAAGLRESRARIWRYPPHTRGRRHKDLAQEEVFVVLQGSLTMLLGEPPERVDLPPESVVSVEPQTALQLRNETDEEVVVFAYGAPPEGGKGKFLDDVEL
jgi:mannose-6-phosphate isomerase-like protein (cupin superfamily)